MLRFPFLSALFGAAAMAQLPPVTVPAENPLTPAKVVLGKMLFWEEQLSSDDSVACGTCHLPEAGGADPRPLPAVHPGADGLFGTADDVRGSHGVVHQDASLDFAPVAAFGLRRQVTNRATGTHLGAAHAIDLFWDGRASTTFVDPETGQVAIAFAGALESQALGPILNPVEMGHDGRAWQDVRQKLQRVRPLELARNLTPDIAAALQQHPAYPDLFAAAFGDPAITAARIAFALASYQRTQIPDDTPWDRFMAGQTNALGAAELAGWNLFRGSARCNACHLDPLFADDQMHNLGLRPWREDWGHYAVSGVYADRGTFKTPTLRNAGLRPRLFHNGQSPPLGDPGQATDPASVLNVYLQGGGTDRSNLDPFLLPLVQFGVTVQDLQLVLEFVRTGLTDPRAAQGLPPFDHPTLRSTALAPPRTFGQALAGSVEPFVVDTVPAFVGNAGFRLGLAASAPGVPAFAGYGLASIEPGVAIAGLPVNVAVLDGRWFVLGGAAGGPGHATWRLPIPRDPLLQGLGVYLQLFALDAAAPAGIAASRGVEFVLR
jgi:cytochrome c peroxidase